MRTILWTMALVAAAVPTLAAPAAFEPSTVTITVKDAKLADVLKTLSTESGNALLALPEKWQEKPVTLDVKDVAYFDALDAICRAAGITYEVRDQNVALVAAATAADVGMRAGPAVIKVATVQKNTAFRDSSPSDARAMTLGLDVFWEDRIPIVSEQCEVTKASVGEGRAVEVRVMGKGAMPLAWCGDNLRPGGSQVAPVLRKLPEKAGDALRVQGTLRLELGSGEKVVTVPNILVNADGRTVAGEDLTVRIMQVVPLVGGRQVLHMPRAPEKDPITILVEVTKPAGEGVVAFGAGAPYGVVLADPQGKRHTPKAVWAYQQLKGKNYVATMWISFNDAGTMNKNWSLLYVYPAKTVSKEWSFDIPDVPMQ